LSIHATAASKSRSSMERGTFADIIFRAGAVFIDSIFKGTF